MTSPTSPLSAQGLDHLTADRPCLTAEEIGRAIFAVECKYLEPALGMKMRPYEELTEVEKELHLDYGRAILALIQGRVK